MNRIGYLPIRLPFLIKKNKLNEVKFNDSLYRIAKGGARIDDLDEDKITQSLEPTDFLASDFRAKGINPGTTTSFTYTLNLPTEVKDSQVINEITAEANVEGVAVLNKSRKGSAIIAVGDALNPNAQCGSTRHLGEEVVCQVALTGPSCLYPIIQSDTRGLIGKCLDNVKGGDVSILKKELMDYRCFGGSCYLQCVQFVTAVQTAMGQPLEDRLDASHYATGDVPGYRNLYPSEAPVIGDLVVWSNSYGGHIAVFLGKLGNAKIIVAEANGETGKIMAGERNILSHNTYPSVYLRYCGENCPK